MNRSQIWPILFIVTQGKGLRSLGQHFFYSRPSWAEIITGRAEKYWLLNDYSCAFLNDISANTPFHFVCAFAYKLAHDRVSWETSYVVRAGLDWR